MTTGNPLTRRELLAALLGSAALSGCSYLERAEGDPRQAEAWPEPEGGIGGTGLRGVGLVGALTDFGSFRVNGRRVETPDDAIYVDAFGPIPKSRIGIGHSLTLETEARGPVLVARRVELTQPLIGAVEEVAEGGRRLRVLGVTVRVDPDAHRALRPGDRVAVSGVWRGAEVAASRLDPAPAGGLDVIAGAMGASDGSGARRVGGARVALPRGARPTGVAAGYVSAVGVWSPQDAGRDTGQDRGRGVLKAERARFGRFTGAAPLTELSVEGYLEAVAAAPNFEISGLGHSFDAAAQLAAFAEGRTLFEGPYRGDFLVATGAALPERFSERRSALRAGALRPEPVARS
ncbi:MAG: DUF5666 domain-containing protein [Pseudomonadota bacterium]